MMTGLDLNTIMNALSILEFQHDKEKRNFRIVSDYTIPNVSKKVVRIILSYTNYAKPDNLVETIDQRRNKDHCYFTWDENKTHRKRRFRRKNQSHL